MRVCYLFGFSVELCILQVLGPVPTSWTVTSPSTLRTWNWDAALPRPSESPLRGASLGSRCWLCLTRALWRSPVMWRASEEAHPVTSLEAKRGHLSASAVSRTVTLQLLSSRPGSRSWQRSRGWAQKGQRWWGSPPTSAGAWLSWHCLKGSLSFGRSSAGSECKTNEPQKQSSLVNFLLKEKYIVNKWILNTVLWTQYFRYRVIGAFFFF